MECQRYFSRVGLQLESYVINAAAFGNVEEKSTVPTNNFLNFKIIGCFKLTKKNLTVNTVYELLSSIDS